MAEPEKLDTEENDELSPAAERVRRKLVRFMSINLAILFAALMAVALAFVYKSVTSQENTPQAAMLGDGTLLTGNIALPAGAEVVSQTLDGPRLSLHLRLRGGAEEILVYDMVRGEAAARLRLVEGQ